MEEFWCEGGKGGRNVGSKRGRVRERKGTRTEGRTRGRVQHDTLNSLNPLSPFDVLSLVC